MLFGGSIGENPNTIEILEIFDNFDIIDNFDINGF